MNLKLTVSKDVLPFLLMVTAIIACTHSISAQTGSSQVIGRLLDSVTKKGVSLATIAIYRAEDTVLVTYRLSDETGNFKVSGLPGSTPLRLVVTHGEYAPFRQNFVLSGVNSSVNFNAISLQRAVQELGSVVVIAEIPPISIRNDTIEFNTNSFRTLPNALVEDLLKKLPGVEVDRDGKISVNGKAVNKIRIDGKDFFGGDIRIATRNLPANIVDKVQVADDKDELERDPDIARNTIGRVINLKLKKGIKKGWFGKAYAGGGNTDRFEAGGILNSFADTMQVSALGYANNINKPGFGPGDLQELGGFGRSGMNIRTSQNGYAVNGISFGGTNDGVQHSSGAGINFNHEPGKTVSVNMQYFYGKINADVDSRSVMQQNISDTQLVTNTRQVANLKDPSHRMGGVVRWIPAKGTTVTYRPSFVTQRNLSLGWITQQSSSNYKDPLNESMLSQTLREKRISSYQELIFVKSFSKQGRSLNISGTISTGDTESDLYNSTENIFFPSAPDRTDQRRIVDMYTMRASLNLSYAEPITKNVILRFSNYTERLTDKDEVKTFDKKSGSGLYDSSNSSLSNDFKRKGWKNTATISVNFKLGSYKVSPGLDWAYIQMNNNYGPNMQNRQIRSMMAPRFSIQSQAASLTYTVRLKEPDAIDLQPVLNNANQLSLTKGNPELLTGVIHSVVYNFMKFNYKQSTTWIVYLDGAIVKDPVVYARQTDEKGVQTISPHNIDQNWRTGASVSFSKKIKFSKRTSSLLRISLNPNYLGSKILLNGRQIDYNNFSMTPNVSVSLNIDDMIEWNNKYTVGYSNSKYKDPTLTNFHYTTQNWQTEMIFRVNAGLIFETSLDYFLNNSLPAGLDKSIPIWNGAVSYLFLKNRQAQLRLSVFDLLNQNTRINRTLRNNYLFESQTRVLQRYGMLTLVYNIRKFRTHKVGGKNSLFSF